MDGSCPKSAEGEFTTRCWSVCVVSWGDALRWFRVKRKKQKKHLKRSTSVYICTSHDRFTRDDSLTLLDERSHAETIYRLYHRAAAGSMNAPKHESCTARWTGPRWCWWRCNPHDQEHLYKTHCLLQEDTMPQTRQKILDNWDDISCCPVFLYWHVKHHMQIAIQVEHIREMVNCQKIA